MNPLEYTVREYETVKTDDMTISNYEKNSILTSADSKITTNIPNMKKRLHIDIQNNKTEIFDELLKLADLLI